MESAKKVRYAIVGLGDIAQEDMMPRVEHTGNSEISAQIASDPAKAQALGEKYDVSEKFTYKQLDQALSSGTFDAIYLASPDCRHAEFIVPALWAGLHVLTEKPLEVSTEKCTEILKAEDNPSVDPSNHRAHSGIWQVRSLTWVHTRATRPVTSLATSH